MLSGILPDKYLKLWLNFSHAVYLLSQTTITHAQANAADIIIKYFLAKSQEYYGETCIVFNMHIVYHLAEHVARSGPIWDPLHIFMKMSLVC